MKTGPQDGEAYETADRAEAIADTIPETIPQLLELSRLIRELFLPEADDGLLQLRMVRSLTLGIDRLLRPHDGQEPCGACALALANVEEILPLS